MVFISDKGRRDTICGRVRQVRIERFGETRGAQKAMAKALGIPYTTYRGYEENRTNDGFLRAFAERFDVPLLWLLCADVGKPSKKPRTSEASVFVNPERGLITSSKYIIVRIEDDAMEPTLSKGSWIGYVPGPGDDLNGKIVVFEKSPGKIIARRLVIRDRLNIAIADNPRLSGEALKIHKNDILGKVVWQFSKV